MHYIPSVTLNYPKSGCNKEIRFNYIFLHHQNNFPSWLWELWRTACYHDGRPSGGWYWHRTMDATSLYLVWHCRTLSLNLVLVTAFNIEETLTFIMWIKISSVFFLVDKLFWSWQAFLFVCCILFVWSYTSCPWAAHLAVQFRVCKISTYDLFKFCYLSHLFKA